MDDQDNLFLLERRFFNKLRFDEQEDYEIIGDEIISIGVSRDAHINLKKNLLASIMAERLGSKSVDNIRNEYQGNWKFPSFQDRYDELFSQIISCVKDEVGNMLIKIESFDKVNSTGLVISRSVLYRLQNSFKSALLLARRSYSIEVLNICRLILEQIAWAYEIHTFDEERIIKTNPTKSIGKFKAFYYTAGSFYGDLSSNAHVSPELTPGYITIMPNTTRIILSSKHTQIKCLYDLLVLTDIFCCTCEFVFKDFVTEFLFLNKEDHSISVRRALKEKILTFDERLNKLL